MRDSGQRPDIGNLNQWIGRRLSKQQLRVRLNRRIPGGQVRQIDVTDADAELREEIVEQTNRRAEQPTRTDDVIALLEQRQTQRQQIGRASCRERVCQYV